MQFTTTRAQSAAPVRSDSRRSRLARRAKQTRVGTISLIEGLELRQLFSITAVDRLPVESSRGEDVVSSASLTTAPSTTAAVGTSLYDSQGFESPRFTLGNLVRQDQAQGPWLQFETASGTGTVQSGVAATGTRSLRIDRQNGLDVRFAPIHPIPVVGETVDIEWTMRVDQAVGAQPYGPFFGIEAYNDQGNGVVRLIGTAGVDAKTGEVLFQQAGTGNLDATGDIVSLNQFHTFKLRLDFDTQQYEIYVDNALVHTEGFVDSTVGNPITGFSDADIAALAASGDAASQAASGTAYIDNYLISLPDNGTVLYNGQGFEAPTFVLGDIRGQDTAHGPWVKFAQPTGSAVVQNTVVAAGTQAVRVERENGLDVRFAPYHPLVTVSDAIEINWKMRVEQAVGPQPYGPFFGVEAYNDQGNGIVKLIGAGGIDAKTGEVLFQHAGSGNLDATGHIVTLGQFHSFKLVLNYQTQTYLLYVDNALVRTEGFVDSSVGNPITGFSDADLSALAASGDPDSKAADGVAYFDDYSVSIVSAPLVTDFIVDDGTAQRSKVRSLSVKFNRSVTLGANAFSLLLLNTGGSGTNDGAPPTSVTGVLGAATSSDGGLTWTIPVIPSTPYSDAFGSLNDGIYTLTVNASEVTDGAGQNLPGNHSFTFHRLFGDVDGNKTVNNLDYGNFRNTFLRTSLDGGFNSLFDFDNNGTINNFDYAMFRNRYGKIYSY